MILEKIKSQCKEQNVSVEKLEELAGIKKHTIYKWNKCEPGASKLYAVAKVLGVSMEYLIEA